MNKKLLRILGKRGRITIPYEIRQRVGFAYNDVLSFTESEDGRSVVIRREKLCDNCQGKTLQAVTDDRAMLLELLDSLPTELKKAAFVQLSESLGKLPRREIRTGLRAFEKPICRCNRRCSWLKINCTLIRAPPRSWSIFD